MKRSEQEKLLRKILPDEDIGDFERASLERGLSRMRQLRRRRYFMQAGALVAIAMAITLGVLQKHSSPVIVTNSQLPTTRAPEPEGKVQLISDEELLALFPDRSVALIGKPGQQRLVFLDQSKSDSTKANF